MFNFDADDFEQYPDDVTCHGDDRSRTEILESHVEMLREMLSPDTDDWVQPTEFVPRIYFDLGSWDGEEWLPSVDGGCGVLLGLDESDPADPKVVLGDYTVFEEDPSDEDGSHEVSRSPIETLSVSSLGSILGAAAPPENWNV